MSTQNATPQPVAYPSVTVGGKTYQFRYTRTTQFLLEMWGFEMTPGRSIPALAWAAAMAGFADPTGTWSSAGFKSPVEFTDSLALDENLQPLYEAVTEALKKVAPKATMTLVESPASDSPSEGLKAN